MNRQVLIDRLTPKTRYTPGADAALFPCRSGKYLFAATDTNAGYFLLADAAGRLLPLTLDTFIELLEEARIYGVKLKNMRVFGARGSLKRAPGVRFYPIDQMVAA